MLRQPVRRRVRRQAQPCSARNSTTETRPYGAFRTEPPDLLDEHRGRDPIDGTRPQARPVHRRSNPAEFRPVQVAIGYLGPTGSWTGVPGRSAVLA